MTLDNTTVYNILFSWSELSHICRTGRYHHYFKFEEIDRLINGQPMHCGMAFGVVESGLWPCLPRGQPCYFVRTNGYTDEDLTLDDEEIDQASNTFGRIIIKVQGGKLGGEIQQRSDSFSIVVDGTTSCKKVVHKHNISHVTKNEIPSLTH
jgi:sRNA-binding regulator protein Hfq